MVFKTLVKPDGMSEARQDNGVMTQQELGLNLSTRRTRKAVFLDDMNLVEPWTG